MPRRDYDALRSLQRFAAGFLAEPWDVRVAVEQGTEPRRPYVLVEPVGNATTDGAPFMQDVTASFAINLYLEKASSRAAAGDAALELMERVWQAVKVGPDPRRPTTDRIEFYSFEPRNAVQRVRVRDATAGTWRLALDAATTGVLDFDADTAAVQAALDDALPGVTRVYARGRGVFDVMFTGTLAGVNVDRMTIDTSALAGPGTVTVILEGAPAPWRSPSDYLAVTSFGQQPVRDVDDPAVVMVAVDLRCAFTRGPGLPWDQMLLQSVTAGNGG